VPLGVIEVNPVSDLEQVRKLINKQLEENSGSTAENEVQTNLSPDWCFVDCKFHLFQTVIAEAYFRQ
jgi:hypothetical protein